MTPLIWGGASLEDLRSYPDAVRRMMGYAPYLAQMGDKHPDAKPLKGFGGAGVLEVVADAAGATYRVVYTVSFPNAVYVLHTFQKKAKRGIATSRQDSSSSVRACGAPKSTLRRGPRTHEPKDAYPFDREQRQRVCRSSRP